MTRRGWFSTLLAPFVAPIIARFAPKPIPSICDIVEARILDAQRLMAMKLDRIIFAEDPLLARVRNMNDYAIDVGTMIFHPLTYAPTMELTKRVSLTIHNPHLAADGAN